MEEFTLEELELLSAVLFDGTNQETQFSQIPTYGRILKKVRTRISEMEK